MQAAESTNTHKYWTHDRIRNAIPVNPDQTIQTSAEIIPDSKRSTKPYSSIGILLFEMDDIAYYGTAYAAKINPSDEKQWRDI